MDANDLAQLLEINKILNSTLDLDKLLTIIVDQAAVVVKAEAGSLMLLDPATNELVFDIALGEKGEQVKQIRLKIGEGIAGWVARERKALIVNDVEKDTRWSSRADSKSSFKTRSMMCVPLIYKDKISGVMEVINKKDNGDFTAEDQHILEALAAQAAVAIENARLFQEVREKKEEIEAVFKGMSDGAVVTDANYQVIMLNESAVRLLGMEKSQLLRHHFLDTLRGYYDFSSLLPELHAHSSASCEMKRREGKNYFLECAMTRINDEQKKVLGYIILLRDITEAKKEGFLKQNFLSAISHKLRTPLTSILGYSGMLMMQQKKEPTFDEFQLNALQDIDRQGQQLVDLINKLLAFTIVVGTDLDLTCKAVDLQEILKAIDANFREVMVQKGVTLEIDASCQGVTVLYGDEEKIKDIFFNLIDNAIKFSGKKETKIRLNCRHLSAQTVEFTIADNGPGIPPEEREKIFQLFYQIEESFTGQTEGAGLGLPLVKRIIEGHGGSIRIESDIHDGSRFIFTLPTQKILEN
ncbi:MAG: ATP-binding protein [bacterium]|nr:ATP-binding protein [bacterium]MDD5353723.1 ATP-binding protein [bacterium]MDD5755885.1 ATP-binding protein [bacterium]